MAETKPNAPASAGFYKRRRGILEHIEAGTIDLLEAGIHDYLCLRANFVIGGRTRIPVGIVLTSAPAIHAHCRRISERTIQRALRHLEDLGMIKTWKVPGKRGNFPTLICRASVHDLSGNEFRVNGTRTIDWRQPVYEPVGEVSGKCRGSVGELSGYREVESRESRNETNSKALAQQETLGAFEEFWLTYPRKIAKPAAQRAWKAIPGADDRVSEIVRALEKWKMSGQWLETRFIPYPATFLNQRRWEDEVPTSGGTKHDRRTQDNLNAAKRFLQDRGAMDDGLRAALPCGRD